MENEINNNIKNSNDTSHANSPNLSQSKCSGKPKMYMMYNSDQLLIYSLLSFFVGGLGFHQFYIGDTTKGIIYLLCSWTGISEILAFVDCINGLINMSNAKKRELAIAEGKSPDKAIMTNELSLGTILFAIFCVLFLLALLLGFLICLI